MRKILIAATAVILTAGASLFGASAAEKLKVGFIYLGPIGDLGWTYQVRIPNARSSNSYAPATS